MRMTTVQSKGGIPLPRGLAAGATAKDFRLTADN